MKFHCKNNHILTRPPSFDRKGATTKCGRCQKVVTISALPPDEQHNPIERDSTARCLSVAYQNKMARRRESLYEAPSPSGLR